jgi:PAS domain S-box-containing protein
MVAKKQKKRTSHTPIPGLKQVHVQIPAALYQQMKAIQNARHRTEGVDPKLCRLVREAVEQYVPSIDLVTGLPKPQQQQQQSVPVMPPLFQNIVNCNEFGSEDELRAAIDRSWLMVWLTDKKHDCIHISPIISQYTGLTKRQMLGWEWVQAVHPEDRDSCVQNCRACITEHRPFCNRYRMKRWDGGWGHMIDWAGPRYHDGRFAGYVGTLYQYADAGQPS